MTCKTASRKTDSSMIDGAVNISCLISRTRLCFVAILLAGLVGTARDSSADEPATFGVMAWNILHGGRDDGEQAGPRRVVEIIRDSRVDIVAMQETYGSGEFISKQLGFHFHPRGTNVSILSRFPVVEDLSVFEEFKCVGALVELPDKRRVAFFSIWLPYHEEIWEAGTRDVNDIESMRHACQASCDDLKKIKQEIHERLSDPKYAAVPIIIAGDFNSMSHLDYIPSSRDQYEAIVDWPTSHVLLDSNYRDAWRELHPEVDRMTDRTWSPRFPEQQQDRIDFVYYRGAGLEAATSHIIDSHVEKFPSDHAALITQFRWPTKSGVDNQVRAVSYNIRHGAGTDDRLDLERTAALLNNLRSDVVGLQEVDNGCKRSGNVDQAAFLGQRTGMQSAFGKFMKYDGGEYGLAILSRYPIERSEEIRLPGGNEPRVALAAQIRLPDGRAVMVVNVHFDWVEDDQFRFAQATRVSEYLEKLEMPYLLLGDFNDVKGSRTLDLLSQEAASANKPVDDHFTFSSTDPVKEIDFIFAAPAPDWTVKSCNVLDGPKTSDHRPVIAVIELNME